MKKNIKQCKICHEKKLLEEFPKQKEMKDGYRNGCKNCYNNYMKNYYKKYKQLDTVKEANKERSKAYRKTEKYKKTITLYRQLNKAKEYQKKYNKSNKGKENSKKYRQSEKGKEKIRKREKEKIKTNPVYALKIINKNLTHLAFRNKFFKKTSKTAIMLGCSYEEFKVYIESKFELWMNWENRGLYNGTLNYGWDLDHIIPLSSAKTIENLEKLCHYSNLQPLCSYVNRYIKKAKINYDQ